MTYLWDRFVHEERRFWKGHAKNDPDNMNDALDTMYEISNLLEEESIEDHYKINQ